MDSTALKTLVDDARKGSKEAFEELVRLTYPKLLKRAMSVTGNIEDARDALQDSYMRAFTSLTNFRGDSSFLRWMLSIVTNASSTLVAKSRRRNFQLIFGENLDESNAETCNEHGMLEKDSTFLSEFYSALGRLPEPLVRVFVLKHMHGLEHREIAETLGISESNAKVRLHRARNQMKLILDNPNQYRHNVAKNA